MHLVLTTGRYNLAAIMRAAHQLCWSFRTTAVQVGPSAVDLEFKPVRVYDRGRLSGALRAVWKQARRERLTWRCNSPAALLAEQQAEAAKRLRWAAEAAEIRRELAAAAPLPAPAIPLSTDLGN